MTGEGDGSVTIVTNRALLLSLWAAGEAHIDQGGTVVVVLKPIGAAA